MLRIERCLWLICFVAAADSSATIAVGQESQGTPATASANRVNETIAGMGIMVGELTPQSVLVQVRLTASETLDNGDVPGRPGRVRFVLRAADSAAATAPAEQRQTIEAEAANDFIARAAFADLLPGTRYVCETLLGTAESDRWRTGPTATFRTLPGPELAKPVKFVVVTGMNYAKFHGDDQIDRKQHLEQNNAELPEPYVGEDKSLGYPALASILAVQPDFFVGTGDNVYYDTPTKGRAETAEAMRRKWHQQFVQPRYQAMFAKVPTYWEIDDHDYRKDDCDNSGDYAPSPELARQLVFEQLPVAAQDESEPRMYRTHRISKDLQIWLVEGRMYRSPNKQPDGPEKTIWGAEQKAWLKRTLAESDATFKVLISPTPMIGPDDLRKKDNHTNIGGFRHERDEFFQWLKDSGVAQQNFYFVCGDRHWQYHAIDPAGFEEFSCGALVDANARLGRKPGDPNSTDPEALIRQEYSQTPASGGFLLISCEPASAAARARLVFSFRDEHGQVLYEHTK